MNKTKLGPLAHIGGRLILSVIFAVMLAALLGVKLQASKPQELHEASLGQAKGTEKLTGLFTPERQVQVSATTETLSVSLVSTQECDDCEAGKTFTFIIRNKLKSSSTEFRIQNDTAQIDSIGIASPSRAVIFGSISATTRSITIVDTKTGTIEDNFYCNFPALSPNGRFLAYVKAAPRFSSAEEWSYVYLVYDLAADSTQNRVFAKETSDEALADRVNVGAPVYPAGNAKRRVYSTTSHRDEGSAHVLASEGLFWVQENILAFVDRWNKVDRLVVADLSSGVSQPEITVKPFNTQDIIDASSCKESLNAPENLIYVTEISSIRDNPKSLRVMFKSRGVCLKHSALDISIN
jgi:hypothetical protein